MTFNPLYLLAMATFGWGFSLAIYRPVANHFGWPMGVMQSRHPLWVTLLAVATLIFTFLFVMMDPPQRWPVLPLGVLFSLFWIGFLRVASQTSLFLAPIAALLLGLVWASTEDGLREMRAIDDKLLDRADKIERRMEDRLRTVIQKAQEKAQSLRPPTLEELEKANPVPPVVVPPKKGAPQ
jgi:hypothetical protein